MKQNNKESSAQRLFRNFLMDNYDTQGPQSRMLLMTTMELLYKFRGTASLSLTEAIEVLQYIGYTSRLDANGQTTWMLYEQHDPIEYWH